MEIIPIKQNAKGIILSDKHAWKANVDRRRASSGQTQEVFAAKEASPTAGSIDNLAWMISRNQSKSSLPFFLKKMPTPL
ncbi:hypothetical protein [Leptospira yanagawae]|uniref:hypothetical protein n=1 Tax=Leptospira yanagawae TaxID=293069 RepID=UPI00058696D7|nr:hypothetical protein [Leptospira yanagawae]